MSTKFDLRISWSTPTDWEKIEQNSENFEKFQELAEKELEIEITGWYPDIENDSFSNTLNWSGNVENHLEEFAEKVKNLMGKDFTFRLDIIWLEQAPTSSIIVTNGEIEKC